MTPAARRLIDALLGVPGRQVVVGTADRGGQGHGSSGVTGASEPNAKVAPWSRADCLDIVTQSQLTDPATFDVLQGVALRHHAILG